MTKLSITSPGCLAVNAASIALIHCFPEMQLLKTSCPELLSVHLVGEAASVQLAVLTPAKLHPQNRAAAQMRSGRRAD